MEEHFSVPMDLLPYARAYESLRDAVTVSDLSDNLVFINSAGEELYGYARSELIGRPLSRILPAGAQFVSAEMLQSSPNGKWEGEVTRARKSGEEFPAQLTATLLRTVDDVIIGTASIVRDLTEMKRLADEKAVLAEVGRIIGSTLDIDEVYERFASEVGKLIPFDRLSIGIPDAEGEYITLAHMSGIPVEGTKPGDRAALAGTLARQVMHSMSGVLIQGVTREHLEVHVPGLLSNFDDELRSFLSVPLAHHDRLVGVLAIISAEDRAYTERHVTLAERVGSQIAGAIANSLLYAQVQYAESEQRRLADENAVLAEVGRIIGSTLDIDDVYEPFASEVGKLIQFDRLGIGIPDAAQEHITIAYMSGFQVVAGRKRGDRLAIGGTLAQQVVQSTSTVLIQDVSRERLEVDVPGLVPSFDKGIRSFLSLPLMHHDRLVGVLQIFSKQISAYSEGHVTLAERVGSEIAGAVANSLLNAELQKAETEQRRLAEENAVLAELGRIIGSTLDIDDVYERFAEEVQKLISFDRISIATVDQEASTLTHAHVQGLAVPGWGPGDVLPLAESANESTVASGKGHLLEPDSQRLGQGAFDAQGLALGVGLRSGIALPLLSRGVVVGTLNLRSKQADAYTGQDLKLAERVAAQIAGAIANSQLHRSVQRDAKERTALAEIGRTISSTLDIEEVYSRFAEMTGELTQFDRININLLVSEEEAFTTAYVGGLDIPGRRVGEVTRLKGTFMRAVVLEKAGLIFDPEDRSKVEALYPSLMPGFDAGFRSFLGVPLVSGDWVIGTLHFQSNETNAYSARDLRLAEQIGAQIAGAIANAQLHASLQSESTEREALAEISRTVSSSQDLSSVYESFAGQVRRIVPFDRMILTFVDPEKALGQDWFVSGAGLDEDPQRRPDALIGTIAWKAVSRRSGVIVQRRSEGEDVPNFPSMIDGSQAGLRSAMAVPVLFQDRPIAAMVFRAREEDAYEGAHLEIGGRVAAQIAGMIASIQLYAELQRQSDERAIIAEIGRIITSSLSINEVYEQCAEKITQLIPSDVVAVNLVDIDSNVMTNSHVSGMDVPGRDIGHSLPLDATLTAAAMENSMVMRLDEVPDLEKRYPGANAVLRAGAKSFLGVPLRSRDEVIGVLILLSIDPNAYDEYSLDLAQRVADQMSGAIANAELHATVQKAALESEVLAKVSRAVSSSTDLSDILDLFARAVGEVIPVDAAGIGLVDHERQTALPRHVTVNSEIHLPRRDGRVAFPLEGSVSGEVVGRGTPVVVQYEDPSQPGGRFPQLLEWFQAGIRSFLAVPVTAGDQVTAVLHFSATDPDAYGPNEVAFAEKVATQISGAVAISRLYADLARQESQLKESEEKNRAIVQAIPDLIFRVSGDGIFLDFQGATDELAFPPEVWLGKPLSAAMPPEVAELAMRRINRAILTGQVQEFEYTLPVPMPDGEVRDWESRTVKAGEDEVLILVRDVTERKRLSAELLQARKMEAVGTLAGGIAHDFNNMLTAIHGYNGLAAAAIGTSSPVRGYLDEIGKASDRAASLTRQLLAFSRQQIADPKVIDLNEIILSMDKMLRRLIREDIELVTLPAEDLRLVQADPGHIEQVLMNLAVNASDAMPEGGKLFIETLNLDVDDELASQHADLSSGDYVVLTVRDTGEGMATEVQSRVFEPFFTTKEVGKGTGMGLSTVYGIIAQNGGAITVESEQGVGTTFRVLFPAVGDEKEDLPLRGDAGFLLTGSETILLVEDESLVRGAEAEVLRHQGYTVMEAANGVEALEAALNADERIDLLVTDLVMPLMGGKELADRLRESQPGIKVLYSTGYTEDTAFIGEVAADASSLLQKPFGPTELAERVRRSLDGS